METASAGNKLKHAEGTEAIIGAFYDVYNELGHGFLESVYRDALAVVLHSKGGVHRSREDRASQISRSRCRTVSHGPGAGYCSTSGLARSFGGCSWIMIKRKSVRIRVHQWLINSPAARLPLPETASNLRPSRSGRLRVFPRGRRATRRAPRAASVARHCCRLETAPRF